MSHVVTTDFHILEIDLLVLLDDVGPGLIGLVGPVDGHSRGFSVKQDPGTFEGSFHPVEFPLGMRLDQHMPGLLATGRSSVGRCSEMKGEAVFAEHTAVPGAAIETDIDLTGFLHHHFQTPGLEHFLDPSLGVSQC